MARRITTRGIYRRYARRKAFERLALNLSRMDFKEIGALVESETGDGVRTVVRLSETRSLYVIPWEDRWLAFVYSRSQREVVTFLPPDFLNAEGEIIDLESRRSEILADIPF